MIELFTANTPNGIKIPIALEELGQDYLVHRMELGSDRLHEEDFLAINPNSKIPAIRHHTGPDSHVTVFESGAILVYLAETFGGLIGENRAAQTQTLSWLFFQVAGLGPAMGNAGHFQRLRKPDAYALDRFQREAERHLQILETRLGNVAWLNGESYSIADVAHFSWVRRSDYAGLGMDRYPTLQAWVDRIEKRPATRRAVERLS